MKRYLDRLDEIPLPSYAEGELDSKPAVQRRDHLGAYANPKLYPFNKMSEKDHRYIRAAYWAMCDLVDEQVGRMLEALERTGQLNNTIVIYMSDHGELLGDHGIYLKGLHFYEESVHVPLIISYPGTFKANTRKSTFVELVDLAPTLLEAAGVPMHPGIQGKSLMPVLTGMQADHREEIFCEVEESRGEEESTEGAVMVRTKTHKLVLHHPNNEGELYDLQTDPQERDNLWDNAGHMDVKLLMMELMCRRLAEKVDPSSPKVAPW